MGVKKFFILLSRSLCFVLGNLKPNWEKHNENKENQTSKYILSQYSYIPMGFSQSIQNQAEHHSNDLISKSYENYELQGRCENFSDLPENTYDHEVERMIEDFSVDSKLEEYIVSQTFDFEGLLNDQEIINESNSANNSNYFLEHDFSEHKYIDSPVFTSFNNNNFSIANDTVDLNFQSEGLIFQKKVSDSYDMIKNHNSDSRSTVVTSNNEEGHSKEILKQFIKENRKINTVFNFDHRISAPLSEYFNRNSTRKIRAYLIANGYEYIAIKSFNPVNFVIIRAKINTKSEVRKGKLIKDYFSCPENRFKTFKCDCYRLTNDSDGKLYLLQFSKKDRYFDICVFTPELECIRNINYKNYNRIFRVADKMDIINLRIHSDVLYLLDAENGRILIANLDFNIKKEIKIQVTFVPKQFVQFAVSNKYIVVLNNNTLYVCKKNEIKKGFESFQLSFDIELEPFEFISENIILAKNHKVLIISTIKICEDEDGKLSIKSNKILSQFKNSESQRMYSVFALDSERNVFTAHACDNEIEVSKFE